MTTFFTSDTHFAHEGIIRHCFRSFVSVQEMDETIIANWNARVGQKDIVWHLGDFTLAGAEVAETYLSRLNGKINLVWGNHDRNSVRKLPRWASSQYATEISLDGHPIILCHYAMRVWNRSHHGTLMLYGHSHAGLPGSNQSLDVGVDAWNFQPVTLPEILDRLATLPPFLSGDHHVAAETETV